MHIYLKTYLIFIFEFSLYSSIFFFNNYFFRGGGVGGWDRVGEVVGRAGDRESKTKSLSKQITSRDFV